jgi:hypothetical protein
MGTRRLSLIATNLILVFTLAACNLPSSGAPSGTKTPVIMDVPTLSGAGSAATPLAGATSAPAGGGSGGCANEYFPVASGAAWTYASSGSVAGDYSYTQSIAGVSDTGFTVNGKYGDVSTTVTWRCKDGNLTEISSGGTTSLKDTVVIIDSIAVFGHVIPATIEAGGNWLENLEIDSHYETKQNDKVVAQLSLDTS